MKRPTRRRPRKAPPLPAPRRDLYELASSELTEATARYVLRVVQPDVLPVASPAEVAAAMVAACETNIKAALLSLQAPRYSRHAIVEAEAILAHAAQMLELPYRPPE